MMSITRYESNRDPTAAGMAQAGHAIVGAESPWSGTGVGVMPWGTGVAAVETAEVALQRVAAGILGGVPPQQFMDSIYTAGQQLGNRAFLRWVREWQGEGRGQATGSLPGEVTGEAVPVAASPVTVSGPLQLMPKKKKKTGEPAGAEAADTLPEATPETAVATVPEPQDTVPQAEPGEATPPGEKKKKKKPRVQVALNTLRAEGVEEFGRYIHAKIGESALLQTLTERITRAQDLGDKRDAALRVVAVRLGELGPERVPAAPQAAAAGQEQVVEKAVVAPIKTALSKREKELFECCLSGNAGRFKHLVRHRTVDINMGSQYGTFLCLAAYLGHTAIAGELLSIPGIDINLAHQTGSTPLYLAAQRGHVEVVKSLLAAPGINANLATLGGVTPLLMAAQNGHEEVAKLLLAAPGINCDTWKGDGATPLAIAVQMNHTGVVEQLIQNGADVNQIVDEDGLTPLCIAAARGKLGVLRLLLQVPCIQVNCVTRNWVTPLSSASYWGYPDTVKLLLEKGADPNITLESGTAPLHLACLRGHIDIVEILLDAGADMDGEIAITTADEVTDSYTPYGIAELMGHREIMTLLEQHRQARSARAVQVEALSPCLRPQGQAPEDGPGRSSPSTALPEPASVPAARASPGASPGPTVAGSRPAPAAPRTPLEQGKHELVQEILRKLEQDNLEPLEGIRLLAEVRASASIDGLCGIYNRLAGIERQRERSRRSGVRRGVFSIGMEQTPAPVGAPTFALEGKSGMDAEGIEEEIKGYVEQAHHRFVSQAVNDMEFGRGKPTPGYPGLLHASAGIADVGSCSVFYYTDAEARVIRIVGIGHHVGRATYRLDYTDEDLGDSGRTLRVA